MADNNSVVRSWSEGLLGIVKTCNSFILDGSSKGTYLSFYVDGKQVGTIKPDVLVHLKNYPDVFRVTDDGVYLSENLTTVEERDSEMERVLLELRQKGTLTSLTGWRDELYSIYYRLGEPPLMNIERTAACVFGCLMYGVHINGYTYRDGDMYMWIARRAKTKATYPDMLDNMVAGGLSKGLGITECAIKECQEEASIEEKYIKNLKPVSAVSYFSENTQGLFPETLYVFDLELTADFNPDNADGEVGEFRLVSMKELKELLVGPEFKPNSALVIVDFLIRHCVITPDNEPNYCYIVEMMHTRLQPVIT